MYLSTFAVVSDHGIPLTLPETSVLMGENKVELIVIGGSAGSFPVLLHLIKALPENFSVPVLIVVHRQRNVLSEFTKIVAEANKNKRILEPDDKALIEKPCIYIAPQNYHTLIEKDRSFSLDYSEAIKFSRPSIDVTFESAARVYKNNLLSILLSGANNDGTDGIKTVIKNGGSAIVQDPSTAEFPAMPRSALAAVPDVAVLNFFRISNYINSLNSL
ncbi:chemotaxis protein CheB [Segetibacter sp.]|jgi:two-component system chemotaxis response regulator CheB|uniref:chemotaxis protein CheB n=1 Tax=Segetibacter sp. TaxID=2231182 RepID=UPI002615B3DA|nr:chemotaxis protein CheB [Segetibacter sp.]MCW3080636.1 chemotaxis protein-glutamate methylesterase [Segetibacter sp.]